MSDDYAINLARAIKRGGEKSTEARKMGYLGNVTEAAEILGVDGAEVWEMVVRGELRADRDNDARPWWISDPSRAARS